MNHLDELFEKSFQEKLQMLEQEWEAFRAAKGHYWTEQRVYGKMLLKLRIERDKMVESKYKEIGKPEVIELVSEYKKDLFTWFQSRHNDYKVNAVYHFMQEDYPKLRKRFDVYSLKMPILMFPPEISYPLSEVFTEEELVIKELASHEAILKFIKKLESVSANEKKVTSFADDVRNLFSESKHDEAFELLTEHLKSSSSLLLDEVIILKSRYTVVQNKFRKNLISPKEESIEVSQIMHSTLAILRNYERENS